MSESTDIKLARMDERLKSILERLEDDKNDRSQTSRRITGIEHTLLDMNARLKNVEENLERTNPAIDQLLVLRNRLAGMGFMGRCLWGVFIFLAGIMFASKEFFIQLFNR